MLRESLGRMRVVFFGVFFCCFARVCTAVVQSRRCWWEAWRLARALAVALLHGTRTMTRGAPIGVYSHSKLLGNTNILCPAPR